MTTSPPAGWHTFGTHAGTATALEFSAATGADGFPLWERPMPPVADTAMSYLVDGVTVVAASDESDGTRRMVTNTITGALAARVRVRLGAASDAEVTITEEHLEWGTDWTREFEATFTVASDGHQIDFFPDSGQADEWLTGAQRPATVRDTVYARFDAWLRAGDDPAGLAPEWFEPHESCDWWESWSLKHDTPLFRAVTRRARGRVEGVTLARIPQKVARDHRDRTKLADSDFVAWRLDGIAPARDDGFRAIVFREHFAVGEYDEWAGKVSSAALGEITDRLMVGESR